MGDRGSKKRQQKQKTREKRVRKDRKAISAKRELRGSERELRRWSPLPEFVLDDEGATDDIKQLVLAGIEKLQRHYVRMLGDNTLGVLGEQHTVGWTALVNNAAAEITDMTRGQVERGLAHLVEKELGNGILQCAPQHLVRRVMPTSCFTLKPDGKRWRVRCRSLSEVKTTYGHLLQSPHLPTVRVNGVRRTIAFTRHAIDQLADRIIPRWREHYIGVAYVFGFLYECVHFGKAVLSNGQQAFVVFNSCLRAGKLLRAYMRELLKVTTDKELIDHYYVVGYCPVVLDDGRAVAKTFLTPGYYQTPERQTLKPGSGRIELLRDVEMASDDGINTVSASTCDRTRSAIKWFHTHGVPQVMKIQKDVFKDMDGPYAWIMSELDGEAASSPGPPSPPSTPPLA